MNISIGSLVEVTAGKYKGLVMVVIKLSATHIFVADGRHRKLEHQKRLNPKHVRVCESVDSIELDAFITNKKLWKQIKEKSVMSVED